MAEFYSRQNLQFLLYEVHDAESLLAQPRFAEHSREIFDLVLDTGRRMGQELLRPHLEAMDREPPTLADGTVRVHPAVRPFLQACGEGGWIGAHADYDEGGQQLPHSVLTAFRFISSMAANRYGGSFASRSAGTVLKAMMSFQGLRINNDRETRFLI